MLDQNKIPRTWFKGRSPLLQSYFSRPPRLQGAIQGVLEFSIGRTEGLPKPQEAEGIVSVMLYRTVSTPMYSNEDDQKQSGIIPYRRNEGGVEVLLVTSNTRKRWIIPKGNIERHLNALESARKEAYEEAGVKGRVRTVPFGSYLHEMSGSATEVEVFIMEVEQVLLSWPEEKERAREWVTAATAYERILEPGLKRLMRELDEELG